MTDDVQSQIKGVVSSLQSLQLKDTYPELEHLIIVSCHVASGTASAEASDVITSTGGNDLAQASDAAALLRAKKKVLSNSELVNFSTPNRIGSLF